MPVQPDPIIAAAPNTTLLRFRFFKSTKASESQILEKLTKRPVIGFRIVADRPLPVTLALPITDEEDGAGMEAVLVPGIGLYDVYTGEAWGSMELWLRDVVKRWGGWLKENHPQPPPPAPSAFERALEGAIIRM